MVTAFDGYPLTRKGDAGTALGVSLVSSVVGGFIGIIILVLFSAPLARMALKFWPAEYFALAILGLSTIASLGGGRWLESFMAVLLGLLLNTIGLDPLSGVSRFTFDVVPLYDGFSFIPVLIGLFALSEVFSGIESGEVGMSPVQPDKERSPWPTVREYLKLKYSMIRAGILGTVIGVFRARAERLPPLSPTTLKNASIKTLTVWKRSSGRRCRCRSIQQFVSGRGPCPAAHTGVFREVHPPQCSSAR